MRKINQIIFCLLIVIGVFSCSKTKRYEDGHSCTEYYTSNPDSTYFVSNSIEEFDRKTVRIGIRDLTHQKGTLHQFSVGDATFLISVSAEFVGDSAYIFHASHYYFENPQIMLLKLHV